eukprot:6818242-Pyramimonas_sp.AAC.1
MGSKWSGCGQGIDIADNGIIDSQSSYYLSSFLTFWHNRRASGKRSPNASQLSESQPAQHGAALYNVHNGCGHLSSTRRRPRHCPQRLWSSELYASPSSSLSTTVVDI